MRGRIYAIKDKLSAQDQLLQVGDYDWPDLQPDAPKPPASAPTPIPPASTPIPTPAPVPDPVPSPAVKDQQDNPPVVAPQTISTILKAFFEWIGKILHKKTN